MARIESAYFGDEKSFRNITDYLISKISGGVLDVTADEKLIPVFETSEKTELTTQDEKKAREEAVKACGGEADQKCLEANTLRIKQERLREKELEATTQNVIKGRRLTLNILDQDGKRKQLVVPDGQKVKLENVTGKGSLASSITLSAFQTQLWQAVAIVIGVFIYVFGIAAVYAIFMRQYEITGKDSFRMMAYGLAVVSALIPYSGYFIILLYFGFQAFVAEYVASG